MLDELDDLAVPSPQETRHIVRRAVAEADPDDLGRCPVKNAQPVKVFVLGHEDDPFAAAYIQIARSRAAASPAPLTWTDPG